MKLTESELRTMVVVFDELMRMPYNEVNTFLGSLTIEEMRALYWRGRRELGLDRDREEG